MDYRSLKSGGPRREYHGQCLSGTSMKIQVFDGKIMISSHGVSPHMVSRWSNDYRSLKSGGLVEYQKATSRCIAKEVFAML